MPIFVIDDDWSDRRLLELLHHRFDDVLDQLDRLEEIAMTDQDTLNSIAAAVAKAVTDITNDFAALKTQPGAGSLDFSAVDTSLAALQALDVANTPGAPVGPSAPVAPADPSAPVTSSSV